MHARHPARVSQRESRIPYSYKSLILSLYVIVQPFNL